MDENHSMKSESKKFHGKPHLHLNTHEHHATNARSEENDSFALEALFL